MILEQNEIIIRFLAASFLGVLIGLEREIRGTAAGIRTNALVCVGSTLYTVLAIIVSEPGQNPGVITSSIITGIGFLGAGAILRTMSDVRGLTTAATIWLVAGVGMAVGYGLFYEAFIVTVIAVIFLAIVRLIEVKLFDKDGEKGKKTIRISKSVKAWQFLK
jgi:putative Mg2+ transporter-C (MgtC) family protein